MSCTRKEFVDAAKSYIGYTSYNDSYKHIIDSYNKIPEIPRDFRVQYSDPWGCTFISYLVKECKACDIIPIECSIGKFIVASNDLHIYDDSYDRKAELGDIIFHTWFGMGDCCNYPTHIGVISQLNKYHFTVIEVFDNIVTKVQIPYCSKLITGFTCPNFSTTPTLPTTSSGISQLTAFIVRGDYCYGNECISRLNKIGVDLDAEILKLVSG